MPWAQLKKKEKKKQKKKKKKKVVFIPEPHDWSGRREFLKKKMAHFPEEGPAEYKEKKKTTFPPHYFALNSDPLFFTFL